MNIEECTSTSAHLWCFQIQGTLVQAVKKGHWILLDEINLAAAETLECLSGLLEGSAGSLVLLDRGDTGKDCCYLGAFYHIFKFACEIFFVTAVSLKYSSAKSRRVCGFEQLADLSCGKPVMIRAAVSKYFSNLPKMSSVILQ